MTWRLPEYISSTTTAPDMARVRSRRCARPSQSRRLRPAPQIVFTRANERNFTLVSSAGNVVCLAPRATAATRARSRRARESTRPRERPSRCSRADPLVVSPYPPPAPAPLIGRPHPGAPLGPRAGPRPPPRPSSSRLSADRLRPPPAPSLLPNRPVPPPPPAAHARRRHGTRRPRRRRLLEDIGRAVASSRRGGVRARRLLQMVHTAADAVRRRCRARRRPRRFRTPPRAPGTGTRASMERTSRQQAAMVERARSRARFETRRNAPPPRRKAALVHLQARRGEHTPTGFRRGRGRGRLAGTAGTRPLAIWTRRGSPPSRAVWSVSPRGSTPTPPGWAPVRR